MHSLAEDFYSHNIQTHKISRELTFSSQFPSSHLRLLIILYKQQPCSLKKLCNILGITTSNGSVTVEKLVKEEMIIRIPDPQDRRKVLLSLTPKCNEMIAQEYEDIYQRLTDLFRVLSPEEQEAFHQALCTASIYMDRISAQMEPETL